MPDPMTVASGISAAGALISAWQLRRRAVRAEAEIELLQAELAAERHAASHDPLTGLPNRRAFFRLAATLLTDPAGQPLVAVVLDLDNFKQVNDRYGHAAGDQVLISVAQRLAAFAGNNLVARLGGDEFAGLLASPTADRRWIEHATRRLCEALAAPIPLGGAQHPGHRLGRAGAGALPDAAHRRAVPRRRRHVRGEDARRGPADPPARRRVLTGPVRRAPCSISPCARSARVPRVRVARARVQPVRVFDRSAGPLVRPVRVFGRSAFPLGACPGRSVSASRSRRAAPARPGRTAAGPAPRPRGGCCPRAW